jgi:SAM-dependent methyltransferase
MSQPTSPAQLDELHTSLLPILRYVLAATALPHAGAALDLACGDGRKSALLAQACGPGVRLIGVDSDHSAIWRAKHLQPTVLIAHWIVGDALALPLRNGSCSAAFCIAALGLFNDKSAALRELRRVLAPGGVALVITATQSWAPVVRWPAAIAERLRAAYVHALHTGHAALAASADLGDDLAALLRDAGFTTPHIRAFLLDAVAHPLAAELPLLGWASLRPLLAAQLTPAELAACDQLAAAAEIELCTLALVGWGQAS